MVWYPPVRGFRRIVPSPYFSLELAERVRNRICQPTGRYSQDYVKVVDKDTFTQLLEKYPKWKKKYKPATSIRGNNFSDKGEIRGANYNDKGHTEVGTVGWMKYSDRVYNNKIWDIQRKDSFGTGP
jgi:hypothetical protein